MSLIPSLEDAKACLRCGLVAQVMTCTDLSGGEETRRVYRLRCMACRWHQPRWAPSQTEAFARWQRTSRCVQAVQEAQP